MKNSNNINRGIGFCELLTITFMILKLCGVITWSWFWVLSPVLIPTILAVIAFFIAFIILFVRKYLIY